MYHFTEKSHFDIHQYHYNDSLCLEPKYSIVARGRYKLGHQSWIVRGGTEVEYTLSGVAVTPYTHAAAEEIAHALNASCDGFAERRLKPFQKYNIYKYVQVNGLIGTVKAEGERTEREGHVVVDRDCTAALRFAAHELQLLRLELRRRRGGSDVTKSLFLGDIHTDPAQRLFYRPTSYQDPLVPANQKQACPLCRLMANSNDIRPPSLSRRRHHDDDLDIARYLTGEWHSMRCETRPLGVFLVRHLAFSRDNRTWTAHYRHYADPYCHRETFTVVARGHYTAGSPAHRIHNTRHFTFDVHAVYVTPHDTRLLQTLQTDISCGTRDLWKLDARQEVTRTNGCATLGITVPQRQYELVKVERGREHVKLYLGQSPTDGGNPVSPERRPSSFQAPLVQCSDELKIILAYGPGFRVASSSTSSGVSTARLNQSLATILFLTMAIASRRFQ